MSRGGRLGARVAAKIGFFALVLTFVLAASEASAHVKWFCAYDIAGQPQGLGNVLCLNFEWLTAIALACLILGCILEGMPVGSKLLTVLDGVTAWVRIDTERLLRAALGFFLVSLWCFGGIILAPELKTDVRFIPWLQLALAGCLIWRRTMPLAGLGIVFLFFFAAAQYGIFHLADYPVFLGIAAYLIVRGLDIDVPGIRPIDLLRWPLAVTLMWASVEKWAYPEWTMPLLAAKPQMTMGVSPELFMQATGVVEFTLAFGLIWTPLVRRVAAIVLAAIFIGAVFEFGVIDAIGHSAIVAILLAVAADDAQATVRTRHVALASAGYPAALAGFLFLYYMGHAALFDAPRALGTLARI